MHADLRASCLPRGHRSSVMKLGGMRACVMMVINDFNIPLAWKHSLIYDIFCVVVIGPNHGLCMVAVLIWKVFRTKILRSFDRLIRRAINNIYYNYMYHACLFHTYVQINNLILIKCTFAWMHVYTCHKLHYNLPIFLSSPAGVHAHVSALRVRSLILHVLIHV